MGLFDEVTVHPSLLPDDAPEHVKRCPVFQTYDLGRGMGDYEITADRKVICGSTARLLKLMPDSNITAEQKWKRKRIELYASNLRGGRMVGKKYRSFTDDGEPVVAVTYVVWIRNGRAGKVMEVRRDEEPALPMSKFSSVGLTTSPRSHRTD